MWGSPLLWRCLWDVQHQRAHGRVKCYGVPPRPGNPILGTATACFPHVASYCSYRHASLFLHSYSRASSIFGCLWVPNPGSIFIYFIQNSPCTALGQLLDIPEHTYPSPSSVPFQVVLGRSISNAPGAYTLPDAVVLQHPHRAISRPHSGCLSKEIIQHGLSLC